MPHSNGKRLSRCLLAALALASPLLARGGEGQLAPVIDLNSRNDEAVTRSLEEPNALLIAADVMPFPADTNPPAGPLTKPHRNSSAGHKQSQPAVRFAEPFDPTSETHPQQLTAPLYARQDAANSELQKLRPSGPRKRASELPRRSAPLVMQATRSPIEPRQTEAAIATNPGTERIRAAKAAPPAEPPILQEQALEVAAASTKRSSPVVELATDPIFRQSPTAARPPQPTLASKSEPVLTFVEQTFPERLAPMESLVQLPPLAATARPVIQLAVSEPLLAAIQPSPTASDLPAPRDEPPLTEERGSEAEELEAFKLDVKPIHELSTRIRPEAGELPKNYAAARFVREGEIVHGMGFSRTEAETSMAWEAPALCYRPLYFEDINLERHGNKIPLVQPALSAAHFFGRVPMLPYMMVNEGHFNCRYTLGHYRPGDYAPYSLYIPRLRLDASAAEVAVAAGVIFAFP